MIGWYGNRGREARLKGPHGKHSFINFTEVLEKSPGSTLFLITNIGVFHGEVVGSRWPAASCSCTNCVAAVSFSELSGHWSTHTGSSDLHLILSAWGTGKSMAARRNFGRDVPDLSDYCWL